MDIDYLLILQELREAAGPLAEQLFLVFSNVLVGAVMVAIPLVIYWCLDKRRGLFVLLSFSMGTLANNLVKCIACVPRPWVRDARIVPSEAALPGATGYSFPSGHSQSAMSVYGASGWAWRDRNRIATVLGGVIVVMVAFSRNFLGVHTPQDVLVAILEAALIIALAERLEPWLEEADDARAFYVLDAGAIITLAFLAFTTFKPYPEGEAPLDMLLDAYEAAGLLFGVAVGWWLERRYVGFEVEGSAREKVVRVLVGVVLVVAVRYGLAAPLGDVFGETWKDFLKAALPVIAGMAGVPALFPLIHKRLG